VGTLRDLRDCRNISGTWAATTSARSESNEELSLDRRGLLAAGPRYNIIRNQSLEFQSGASVVFNSERFTGEERTKQGEVKLTLCFDMFEKGDVDLFLLTEGFVSRNFDRLRFNFDGRIA
jgi:hypothetical protein